MGDVCIALAFGEMKDASGERFAGSGKARAAFAGSFGGDIDNPFLTGEQGQTAITFSGVLALQDESVDGGLGHRD